MDKLYLVASKDCKVTTCLFSVCEKFQATRAKVAPVNLIYGSHFSATEATYEGSQNMENFVESLYIQEVDVSQSHFM